MFISLNTIGKDQPANAVIQSTQSIPMKDKENTIRLAFLGKIYTKENSPKPNPTMSRDLIEKGKQVIRNGNSSLGMLSKTMAV